MNKNRILYLRFIPIILITLILYKLIQNFELVKMAFGFIAALISPFVLGFVIAYLLNPLLKLFEKRLKFGRNICILFVYLLVLGLISLGITVILPGIAQSIADLIKELPKYIDIANTWISKGLVFASQYGIDQKIEQNLSNIIQQTSNYLDLILTAAFTRLISFTSAMFNFLLGLVISIYFLADKEGFGKGIKRLLYGLFEEKKMDGFISFAKEMDYTFSKYIVGQMLDSILVGILCFIGLSIMQIRYALLFSVIVGITNMIPYFGPIIGLIPAVAITLFINPIKALWILIFIILLQQFDSLLMAPRIIGEQVGLKPIWIMFAIIIGGGTFGIIGLLLAVPLTAVIKKLVEEYIDRKLKTKNIQIE